MFLKSDLNSMANNYNVFALENGLVESKPAWIDEYYDIKCQISEIAQSPYGKYPLYYFGEVVFMEFQPFFNTLPT